MSPNKKNVLVGLCVMGSLVGLFGLLLKFGGTSVELFNGGHSLQVEFRSDRSDGLAEGAQVLYRGYTVGKITAIRRDRGTQDIIIDAEIDNDPPLPGNVVGAIKTTSLVSGVAAMSLESVGGDQAAAQGTLVNHQKLMATYVGADLIPAEFTAEIRSAGDMIKGINSYVNDPAVHADLQKSIENIRHITENVQTTSNTLNARLNTIGDEATRTLDDAHKTVLATQVTIEHLSRQIDDRMLQVSKSLDTFQSIAAKVNAGQGTAGQLVNDPKLYQSLVDSSRELNATIVDLKRLVDQWEQEGVTLKLK